MEGNARDIRLYSGTSHPKLAESIAQCLGQQLGHVTVQRFPDGEIFVQYKDTLRNADAFIIQSTSNPTNENLMELLIMLDAARRASAARITAVIPFFGYARQDRKDKPRVPITAKLVANLLTTAGANRILAMDLHSQQIQGFFDIPVDHLYAASVLIPYLRGKTDAESVIVSPDSGSVKMAQSFADRLGCGFAVVAKRRLDANHVASSQKMAQSFADRLGCGFAVVAKRRLDANHVASSHLVGDVKGRTCVLVDDMTSTAGTLCAAAELLKREGAAHVVAAVSHFLAREEAFEKLQASCIEELITTNSVPTNLTGKSVHTLDIAPLLSEAISRIHNGDSLNSLFQR